MATMTVGLLVAIILLVVCISVLVGVGVTNIRAGLQGIARAQELGTEPVWHQQPKVWFGLNNLVLAVLLLFVLGVAVVTEQTARILLFVCLGLTFLLSLGVVIRSMQVSLRAVKNLQARPKQ